MKPLLLLSAFFIYSSSALMAQDDIASITPHPPKHIPSSATVRLTDGLVAKGWLYQVNDSQLVVLHARKALLKKLNDPGKDWDNHTTVLYADQIKSVSVRRKNAGRKGVLLGFLGGAFIGAIAGFAEGDDKIMPYPDPSTDPYGLSGLFIGLNNAFAMTAGEKALTYGMAMGVGGGILGGILGAVAKKKFIIGGKKEKFHDVQGELMRRLITK